MDMEPILHLTPLKICHDIKRTNLLPLANSYYTNNKILSVTLSKQKAYTDLFHDVSPYKLLHLILTASAFIYYNNAPILNHKFAQCAACLHL